MDVKAFEKEAKRILKEVEEECSWMYETKHTDGRIGKIKYTIWSDVFVCPYCANEIIFWETAVDKEAGKVKDEFHCPNCSAKLTKRNMERAWVTRYDPAIKETIKQAKQLPSLVKYTVGGKRADKKPDEFDLALIEKIKNSETTHWFPINKIPIGEKTVETHRVGLTNQNHMYSERNLQVLSRLYSRLSSRPLKLVFQSFVSTLCSKLVRYNFSNRGNGILTGTIYVPSLFADRNVLDAFSGKIKDFSAAYVAQTKSVITTESIESIQSYSEIFDYVFIDPPFGSNIQYSELNLFWEAWMNIYTNNIPEAVENKKQGKGSVEYRRLMTSGFKEIYRLLKPGRWMTVEFSNTKASVWNSIQIALTEAGFIIANVSALDKKQGSFNAVTNTTSVKQDLVISAYKPNGGFEERFQKEAQTEAGVWDFVRTHLEYLPVTKYQGDLLQMIPERDPRILFDQMVAYYVQKGYPVPISSQEFQIGLGQRFIERDGMYFLPEQAAEYDRKKLTSGQLIQTKLFVSDESSAIQWLRQLLKIKPQTFQDINPQFMQELGGWSKNEQELDLRDLLSQNFLSYNGISEVPSQIHSYLSTNWPEMRNRPKDDHVLMDKAKDRWYVPDPNKAGDLEKLRERSLLKEFEEYKQAKKKLKVFRMEAVRAGFKKAWQERDYSTIIKVADMIPNKILEEDQKLLMWYDQAVTRVGG